MKDLKITKGNWMYNEYTPYDYGVYSDCEEREGRDIAIVRSYANDEETLANAKLIAAAPDLLKALEKITDWVKALSDWVSGTTLDPDIRGAEEAIKKATE